MPGRVSKQHRETKETNISLVLDIDGNGTSTIETPVPFLGHMLDAFSRHGRFNLEINAKGDVEVDPHHTVEDIGLTLGDAFTEALGEKRGLIRYGSATIPMDDTLATVAVDFGGRPAFEWRVPGLRGRKVGTFDCELAQEFFAAFANRAQCNLHCLLHYGGNAHHIIEAVFKAFARASDTATQVDQRIVGMAPSTKGTVTV